MTKILVLSDSHRDMRNMIQAVQLEKPDMIFHLGDHIKDALMLQKNFPDIPLEMVPGNCDFEREAKEKLLTIDGKKIMLCHGHEYSVKSSPLTLEYVAREKGVDLVCFGHTHSIYCEQLAGLAMLNPGSIGDPRYPGKPSYGVILIENGELFLKTHILRL